MNPVDIASVLAKAAAFDQRTVGQADILAWHEALSDLEPADALAAVTRHYASSEQRIMPVHVRRHATELRRQRRELEREEQQQRALAAYAADAGPLTDRAAEIRAFVGQVRGTLPDGDREALMPRTVAWEREHRAYERAAAAEPNPDYDPRMAPVAEWNAGKADAPAGAWWADDTARERHAKTLLAEAGRLRPSA
jgi:hypothetical protein